MNDPKSPPSAARVLAVSLGGGLGLGAVGGAVYALLADKVLAHGLGTGWLIVGLIALALGLLGATEPPEGWRRNRVRKSAASRLAVDTGASEEPPKSWELLVWALVVGGGLVVLSMIAFYYAAR